MHATTDPSRFFCNPVNLLSYDSKSTESRQQTQEKLTGYYFYQCYSHSLEEKGINGWLHQPASQILSQSVSQSARLHINSSLPHCFLLQLTLLMPTLIKLSSFHFQSLFTLSLSLSLSPLLQLDQCSAECVRTNVSPVRSEFAWSKSTSSSLYMQQSYT